MKRKLRGIFFLLFMCVSIVHAQQKEIHGRVTDNNNGEALVGVSVMVKGTSSGTSTDAQGNFSLEIDKGKTLVFTYLGYESQEIVVGDQTSLSIKMTADQGELGEVVVTAMGISREKRSLGYASQEVNNESLTVNQQPNVVNALQGKVAGVTINSTGGAPGQGANIQIRGVNSIDPGRDNSPLFVIDGVLMDNSTSDFGAGSAQRGMGNRASDINPANIETINILKGGAATALYGLRGANGVVVITTKRGKAGSIQIDYNSSAGVENVNKFPDIQDKYSQGWMGEYNPDDFWPSFGPTVEEAKAIDPTHPDHLYNHVKDAFVTGNRFSNDVTFSGGTDKLTFLTTISQLNQEGVLPFTDYKKYAGRLNAQYKVSDKITTGASMSYTNSGGYHYNAGRYNEQLVYWSPRHDVWDYKEDNGTMRSYGETDNPIYIASTNRLRDNVNRFIGSFNFQYDPLSWLSLSYRAGMDYYSEGRLGTAVGSRGLEGERLVSENGIDEAPGRGYVNDYNTQFRTMNSTFIATLSHDLTEDLHGTLRLGHELYDRQINSTGAEGGDLTVYNWFDLRNAKIVNLTQEASRYRLMGLFGELSFDYKNFLYLTLTGRNDITSSLVRPNNSFFYPSASLSYILSEHLSLPEAINYAKFRVSYAQIGKDADAYSTSSGFTSYVNLPTGYTGFTRAGLLGDPTLVPEFTNTFETGLEMSFLDSRLGFDFSYYHSLSKDQIIQVPISSATGYVEASVNAGSMRNTGVEITVNAVPVKTDNFTWNTQVNFSANRNKIMSIRDDLKEITVASEFGYGYATTTMKLIEGQSYGSLFGTALERYYTEDEIAAGLNHPTFPDESRPLLIGPDGFPVGERTEQTYLGNVQPDWIGGWSNTFRYKRFSLMTLVDARVGQDRYNQLANFYAAFGMSKMTEDRNTYRVFDGVTADGKPNTQEVWLGQGVDPKTGRDYDIGYYRSHYRTVSENFVEDASWVRLRTVSLTYNMPEEWFQRTFIKHLSLTATGNNLWLGTKYSGYDPETSTFASGSNIDGFSGFTYPAVRSFLFTLNVGF